MLRMRRGPPVDYRLCNQTVTIYHQISAGKEFRCTRTVFHGAFLDFKKVTAVEKTGSRETNSFLLVLPSGWSGRPVWMPPQQYDAAAKQDGEFTLAPKDKVMLGEGPEITTREQWAALLPAQTTGLVVVRDVDPKYWQTAVCHVEAAG